MSEPKRVYGPPEDPRIDTAELMQFLGVSRQTLVRWQPECGPLEDEPFLPEQDLSAATGMQLNTWSLKLAKRILESFKAAKKGRYVDQVGEALLDVRRVVKALRKVRESICERTVFEWLEQGCVHLPADRKPTSRLLKLDRGPGPASRWIAESDVRLISESLAALSQGRYGNIAGDPCLFAKAAAKLIGCTIKTVYDREKAGAFQAEKFRSKRGSGAGKKTKTFRRSALIEDMARRTSQPESVFDRDDPGRCRITIEAAADELGVTPSAVRKYVSTGQLHPQEKILPYPKRRVQTVFRSDVRQLKDARHAAILDGRREGDWKTQSEICDYYQIRKVGEIMDLGSLLRELRDDPQLAQQRWIAAGSNRWLTWFYDFSRLQARLAGEAPVPIQAVAAALAPHAHVAAAGGDGATLMPPKESLEQPAPRTRRKPGPKLNPMVQHVHHVCADVYNDESYNMQEKKRACQLADVQHRLTDKRKVRTVSTMRLYAKRHKPEQCPECQEC
jgi:hypothetical protein